MIFGYIEAGGMVFTYAWDDGFRWVAGDNCLTSGYVILSGNEEFIVMLPDSKTLRVFIHAGIAVLRKRI